jgi:uridine phosphorylase
MNDLQHHIRLSATDLRGNGDVGRYVFLPGDPGRAARIATAFEDVETRSNPRGFTAYLGTLPSAEGPPVDVLALPSGVGSASSEIVIRELLACGARRLLRVGSCGSMAHDLAPGSVVIATGAVRDELTSRHYAPLEVPALAHFDAVAAMRTAARHCRLEGFVFCGLCHSKASLYAREFGHGPLGEEHIRYGSQLKACGVIATEMEASTLFILASTQSTALESLASTGSGEECRAGAVLAVFAHDDSQMDLDQECVDLAEGRAIQVALEGVRIWAHRDRGHGEI